jgi:hypothetical protein
MFRAIGFIVAGSVFRVLIRVVARFVARVGWNGQWAVSVDIVKDCFTALVTVKIS